MALEGIAALHWLLGQVTACCSCLPLHGLKWVLGWLGYRRAGTGRDPGDMCVAGGMSDVTRAVASLTPLHRGAPAALAGGGARSSFPN